MIRRLLAKTDRALYLVTSALVVAILLVLVGLSFGQVLLRNLFDGGLNWADAVLRHLVLALGMFGAVLAAHQSRQISIDLFSRVTEGWARKLLDWVGGLFTIAISVTLALASIRFVASEMQFDSTLAPGLPAWPFQLAIPVGFGLIALQVLLNLLLGRKLTGGEAQIARPDTQPPETPAAEASSSDEEARP